MYTACFLATLWLVVFRGAALRAQTQSIAQMVHMSWSGRDGAPQGLLSVAQAHNGLLWLAGAGGLHSFDGVRFEPFRPPGGGDFVLQIFHFLYVGKDGDLWMFAYHGPPGRLHDGKLRIYDQILGPPIDELNYPQQEPDGTMWAVLNERQLVRLDKDGMWRTEYTPGNGLSHVTALFIDTDGTMWVLAEDRLYRRTSKAEKFEITPIYIYGQTSLETGPEHDLWIASEGLGTAAHPARHLQHLDRDGNVLPAPDVDERLKEALPAPDGFLWALTVNNVLLHLSPHDLQSQETIHANQYPDRALLGASAETSETHAVIRGSDGGLWVGGMGGLEHFAKADLVRVMPGAPNGFWSSCTDRAGTVWISDPNDSLYRLGTADSSPQLFAKDIRDIFCSADGTVTLETPRGISILRDNRIDPLPAIPDLHGFLNHFIFTGASRTGKDTMLAVTSGGAIGRSLWALKDGHWQRILAQQQWPEITALYSDGDGKALLGLRGSDAIPVIEGSALKSLLVTRPGIQGVVGFARTSYGLFAYGTDGIALEKEDGFHTISFAEPENAHTTTGLAESDGGDLWINGGAGIVRIEAAEIQQALADPRHAVVSHVIQEGDIVGPAFPRIFSNSAQRGAHGRLFFSTVNGIVCVDPAAFQPPPLPRLSIGNIRGDSRGVSTDGTFPPDLSMVTIDYVGVDYKNPGHVSYRYRLDGYETAWQNAGQRTEAIYTHLRPGSYRFEVMARNAYGVWTSPVASASFTILPRFYQQLPFQILCGCLLLFALWLLVRAQLQFEAAAIRERAEERADERISIARDLHDTLLQGIQGLLLTFHAAAERVPDDHESKHVLERALSTADKIIVEGRDRVKGLRSLDLVGEEFCAALKNLGEDLNASGAVNYSVSCQESQHTLTPHIASEVFLIAREAVMNAFRHGQASAIAVRVRYGRREFTLECHDDGHGFEPGDIEEQTTPGHWGIRGMTERAQRLRAKLEVQSAPGEGTIVTLTLKARRAYEA
jgi:signal transduction histidine kinase